MSDKALSIKQTAEMLGIAIETLYNWRKDRKGPPSYAYSRRKIVYREREVRRWMDERREHTGDEREAS